MTQTEEHVTVMIVTPTGNQLVEAELIGELAVHPSWLGTDWDDHGWSISQPKYGLLLAYCWDLGDARAFAQSVGDAGICIEQLQSEWENTGKANPVTLFKLAGLAAVHHVQLPEKRPSA